MSTELLPCPYCGSKAEVYSFYGANSDKILYTPRCIDVACLAHRFSQTYASKKEAIAAWNRRFVCLDKNRGKVFAGDRVRLECGCCEYTVELRNGFAIPIDDGQSQVHGRYFNVWAHEIELIKEDKNER